MFGLGVARIVQVGIRDFGEAEKLQYAKAAVERAGGVVFDSSTCFTLPNGAKRSPDAAWIASERWNALSEREQDGFSPITPDFVLERRSATDALSVLEAKLAEYLANGARLGWLIDPQTRRVHVYRPGGAVAVLENPEVVSGEDVLVGFELRLPEIWV